MAAADAAARGDTAYFSGLSDPQLQPQLTQKDEDGRSLLHTAAGAGAQPRVRPRLSAARDDSERCTRSLSSPLVAARCAGHADLVEHLLQRGGDAGVNASDDEARRGGRAVFGAVRLLRSH